MAGKRRKPDEHRRTILGTIGDGQQIRSSVDLTASRLL